MNQSNVPCMKLEIEKSSILDFTKVQVIQEGVSLQKLPNCGAPLCTGGCAIALEVF